MYKIVDSVWGNGQEDQDVSGDILIRYENKLYVSLCRCNIEYPSKRGILGDGVYCTRCEIYRGIIL